ncbi:MAG: LegC family aminotransferase [Candidatus Rokuibacteriota bacterium]|nr:MAG: LegC family aminotransferase [Candidatus Rokubacteria bacterium]
MTRPIPNAVPCLRGNEWQYLKECLDSNWVSSVGPFVDRFERELAGWLGVRYGVATVNGTAALHVALLVAGVEAGDEVLVPALTFVATANAVRYCGAVPVFMDSEPRTWTVDPQKVADFLTRECDVRDGRVVNRTTGRRVRALLPVHLYGHPADLDPLLELAARFPLALVEDAAEALGASYKGRRVGAHGSVGCLSFNGNKIITTGGGGMILTDDEALARRARSLTTQARDEGPEWIHREVGFNYRLTNLQAALGVAQLEQLEGFVAEKRETARVYAEALAALGGAEPLGEAPWATSSFWMSSTLLDPARYGDARALIARANAEGIQLRPLWRPLHRQPVFAGQQAYRIEVADHLYARGVSLPCSVGITPEERLRVLAFLAAAGDRPSGR